MTRENFYNIIDEIIEVPTGTIRGDEPLSSLEGWDSLSVVAFIAAYDKHFGSPPSALALVNCKTVDDLRVLAQAHITE